jgi:hypothetical protein
VKLRNAGALETQLYVIPVVANELRYMKLVDRVYNGELPPNLIVSRDAEMFGGRPKFSNACAVPQLCEAHRVLGKGASRKWWRKFCWEIARRNQPA